MMSLSDPRPSPSRGRSRRKRKSINSSSNRRTLARSGDTNDEEAFIITFFKVGTVVLLFSCTCYVVFLQRELWSSSPTATRDHSLFPQDRLNQQSTTTATTTRRRHHRPKISHAPLPVPTIGVFDEESAQTDAYGLSLRYFLSSKTNDTINTTATNIAASANKFIEEATHLLSQFTQLVGTEDEARAILQRSLLTVTASKKKTIPGGFSRSLARRLYMIINDYEKDDASSSSSTSKKPTFSIAVLGSTAASGAGNAYNQSYASVIETIMTPVFDSLGLQLQVRNLAIDETTEFPTIWCFDHFWSNHEGRLPDVVVWDFGPTSTPESFEALLRNLATMSPSAAISQSSSDNQRQQQYLPFLIVRDNKLPAYNDQRDRLLRAYTKRNILVDPLLVHDDRAVAPYLKMREEGMAKGFVGWRATASNVHVNPGQRDLPLSAAHHNMVGWLMSMHLLTALEWLAADQFTKRGDDDNSKTLLKPPKVGISDSLPPPMVIEKTTRESWMLDKGEEMVLQSTPAWLSMLVGEATEKPSEKFRSGDQEEDGDGAAESYKFLHRLRCRTSYLTDIAPSSLDTLIISGLSKSPLDTNDLNKNKEHVLEELLLPKSSLFSSGWVQDIDKPTKRKMQLKRGQNTPSTIKKAYFGLPRSRALSLFIPLSQDAHERAESELNDKGFVSARDYVDTVTLCETDVPESNDEGDATCRLYRDASVIVGNEVAFPEPLPMDVSVSCVTVNVPDHSSLVYRQEAVKEARKKGANHDKSTNGSTGSSRGGLGLSVDIEVRSLRGTFREPCSVAHVLWNEVGHEQEES